MLEFLNMLDVQNIRDYIFHISVLLLSRHPFLMHFEIYICMPLALSFAPSLLLFLVSTQMQLGSLLLETKKKKRKKSLCGSCSSTACQVNIIMHIRSASSCREEG